MIDISEYKAAHGRGPGETTDGQWTFRIESCKTVTEFVAPPGSTYGAAAKSAKQLALRTFPGQRHVKIVLLP